jgi:DNA-binding GntR family transcriptional regulator
VPERTVNDEAKQKIKTPAADYAISFLLISGPPRRINKPYLGWETTSASLAMVRLRKLDGTALAVKRYFVPADLFNNKWPARRELRALVVDDILRRRNMVPATVNVSIRPERVSIVDARLLGTASDIPVLISNKVCFDAAGRAIRLTQIVIRG